MKPSAPNTHEVACFGSAVIFRERGRAGVTLTEVLMSLMIMSIGISAVMVLFPISVLRSVQSTQLTNAAILKYNTEAQIRQNPRLVFDPDGDGDMWEHVSSPSSRNYVVDPIGFYSLVGGDNDGTGTVDNNDVAFANRFGNISLVDPLNPGKPLLSSIPRFDGGVSRIPNPPSLIASEFLASQLARLGDGRTILLDTSAAPGGEIPLNAGGPVIGVTLDASIDPVDVSSTVTVETIWQQLTENGQRALPIPVPVTTEITLFSLDGRISQTFPLLRCRGNSCYWNETNTNVDDYNLNRSLDTRPLPREFQGKIGRVVIKAVRPADFSWLLTVRRGSDGNARGVDIVVRYHTGVQPADEQVFPASFDRGFGLIGVNDSANGLEPVLKRGSYVFDAKNARWYRITDYQIRNNLSQTAGNAFDREFWKFYKYRVILESAVVADVGRLPKFNGTTSAFDPPVIESSAMFVPGVVDVYPLGSLSMPADLAQEAR